MINYNTYNSFFTTTINKNVVIFCITFSEYKDINKYKKWVVNSNWPKEISRFEYLNLNFYKV